MKMEETHVCFIDIPTEIDGKTSSTNCSQSPLTPSPRLERNLGFFHLLSRRLGGRRSHDDLIYNGEDDLRSSSTDSCSSTTGNLLIHNNNNNNDKDSHILHNSNLELSCGSSDTSSTVDDNEKNNSNISIGNRLQRRSTSSIRRALKNFSISTRSLSCSGTPLKVNNTITSSDVKTVPLKTTTANKSTKKSTFTTSTTATSATSNNKKQPQRILRQPVSYTYVKGMSGLPTQRVPRSTCCHSTRR